MKIKTKTSPRGTVYVVEVDDKHALHFVPRGPEADPTIALAFRQSGSWYFQSLMWSCRGARGSLFLGLVALYRYLRKNLVTDHSLRFLAWGSKRTRNGGYAVGTKSYKDWVQSNQRWKEKRLRENMIDVAMRQGLQSLNVGQNWKFKKISDDRYKIGSVEFDGETSIELITVDIHWGCAIVRRTSGRPFCSSDVAPDRRIAAGQEDSASVIADDLASPAKHASMLMEKVRHLMERHNEAVDGARKLSVQNLRYPNLGVFGSSQPAFAS